MPKPFVTYKLIVLYMLENSREAITNSQITDFILNGEYTGYFQLQEALSELVEADLITKNTIANSSFYSITKDGKNTLKFFQKDLSPQIREEVLAYLTSIGKRKDDTFLRSADYYAVPSGGYAVRCRLIDKGSLIIELNMAVPGKGAAESICQNWSEKCEDIYTNILEELL